MCRPLYINTRKQISQAFPLHICILQAIKYWRWEQPGNKATVVQVINILKSLYRNTVIPIPLTSGVKQGCMLSPTLFKYNLFINGLIEEMKKLGLGVKCVWGFKPSPSFKPSKTKQIKHVRGVGQYCPVDLLEGVPIPCRHQFEMLCLATMDDSRLTKKI